MRKVLLALLVLTALATPASAAQIDVNANINGEPVNDVEATISEMGLRGGLTPVANATIESGEASFTDLGTGLYSVSFETEGGTYRDGTLLRENGTTRTLNFTIGPGATGTVTGPDEPLTNTRVSLSDVFGPFTNVTTGPNGTFSTPPLMEGSNYTAEVTYRGYPFSKTLQSGDTGIRLQVTEPVTDPSVLEFAPSQVSQLHADRTIIVDFNSTPTRVTDFSPVRNPTDRPFTGTVTIELPRGANLRGVTDLRRQPLDYSWRNGSAVVQLSLDANSSVAVGARYTVPGTSYELSPGRDLESATMMLATPPGTGAGSLTPIGPVSIQPTDQLAGISFVAQATGATRDSSFGVQFEPSSNPVSGITGSGGSTGSLLIGAVAAAAVIAGLFLYQNRDDLDLPSLGGTSGGEADGGDESSGGFCPGCGAPTGEDDSFCPNCGENLN